MKKYLKNLDTETENLFNEIRSLLSNKNSISWHTSINASGREHLKNAVLRVYPSSDFLLSEALKLIINQEEPPYAVCGRKCKYFNGQYDRYCSLGVKPNKNTYCEKCNKHWREKKNKSTKENCLNQYNVEHPFQRNDVKTKVHETKIRKYGTNYNKIISNNSFSTYYNKTGYSCPLSNPDIQQKIKETNIKNYGYENPGSSPLIVQKRKNTQKKLYGHEHSMQNGDIKLKVLIKSATQRMDSINSKLEFTNFIPLFDISDLIGLDTYNKMPYWCNTHGLFYSCSNYKIICNECTPVHISTQHKEILNFIENLGIECVTNTRSVLKSTMELHIFIPDLNVAIEINGMYWHSTEYKERLYHQNKMLECKEHGIHLIQIWEDEWNTKQDLVKFRLMNVLKCSSTVYARKCKIKEINKKECDDFINTYHIQGSSASSIRIGLYYENELYAVMTFGKSRFDKTVQYELIRYCSKSTVVGGASKLLKYFEKKYKPVSLISYADACWSTGDLYIKLGFTYNGLTEPGYFYYKSSTGRISRHQCQKKKLVNQGYDENLSEYQICTTVLKYNKIFDCGNFKFTKYYI